MRLLVVSHTPHYRRDGVVVGWGSTVRELDVMGELFEQIVHVAPLHPEPAPPNALPYLCPRVRLRAVAPAGGEGWRDKLGILARIPAWRRTILQELRQAEAVHVRCPAGIGLLALALLAVTARPRARWVKYAGDWQSRPGEPWSYRLQRWWLTRGWRLGAVTVNGSWPGQPAHVHSFFNPSFTDQELAAARARGAGKPWRLPVRLLFVGRLEAAKGAAQAVEVVERLARQGLDAILDMAGDGPEHARLQARAGPRVRFHGWRTREEMAALYAGAHILLLPSRTEGWPKVLSEAMAYGVVPVASAVGSIPQLLERFGAGRALEPGNGEAFAAAVAWYAAHPEVWQEEAERARRAAASFRYAAYLEAVRRLVEPEAAVAGAACET